MSDAVVGERTTFGGSLATISALNALSRITGLVRVVAVAAALGVTFAGNTYHSSNLVSNVLFELLAAGLLSTPIVPAVVGLTRREGRAAGDRLLGSLLGVTGAALAVVAVVIAVAGRWVMGALLAGTPAAVRDDAVDLGGFLLVLFAPQLVLYAVGAVATAALHAERRFAASSAAPIANNLAVIATMLTFIALHGAGGAGLDLLFGHRLLLGAGTTFGVLAMSLVPFMAARRAGWLLKPSLDIRTAGFQAVMRQGAWAGLLLGANQVLVAATLVFANRVEGGVVAYQMAFTFVLLPYALLAHPVVTSLLPALSAHAADGDRPRFAADCEVALRLIAFTVIPASAVLAAVGPHLVRVIRAGALGDDGARFVGAVVAAYAAGLIGYAVLQLLARAFAALGDTRTPAFAYMTATGAAVALMVVTTSFATGRSEVVWLGVATSSALVATSAALTVALRRRIASALRVGGGLARSLAVAAPAGAAAWFVARWVDSGGRSGAAIALVAGAGAATLAAGATVAALRPPELAEARRAVRSAV